MALARAKQKLTQMPKLDVVVADTNTLDIKVKRTNSNYVVRYEMDMYCVRTSAGKTALFQSSEDLVSYFRKI